MYIKTVSYIKVKVKVSPTTGHPDGPRGPGRLRPRIS